jgi:hypothetical protein
MYYGHNDCIWDTSEWQTFGTGQTEKKPETNTYHHEFHFQSPIGSGTFHTFTTAEIE